MLTLQHFLSALALVFVFEGIFPFICPQCWRNAMQRMREMNDQSLRIVGLTSMVVGVLLLYFVHS